MRKALFAIVVLVVGASSLPAQTEAPWAEKLFDRKIDHDFGNVARGTQLNYKFVIKNIYAVPLDVKVTTITCNCTQATTSTTRVEPHGTGHIDTNMNAGLFTGSRTVRVSVQFSNDKPLFYSTAILSVTAFSRGDIVLKPGEVNFGGVKQGQDVNPQIMQVDYIGAVPGWAVGGIVTNGLPVDAKLEGPTMRGGAVSYKVNISLKPDAPVGSVKGEMYLKTNDAASPLLPVLVEANVEPALTVAPRTARITAKVNVPHQINVAVRGHKAFSIRSVSNLGDDLRLENQLPDAPADVHRLTFVFKKGTADEGFHRKIEITTDLQQAPVTFIIDGTVSDK